MVVACLIGLSLLKVLRKLHELLRLRAGRLPERYDVKVVSEKLKHVYAACRDILALFWSDRVQM